LLQSGNDSPPDDVWQGAAMNDKVVDADDVPDAQAHFADLPSELGREKSYAVFLKQLKEHLYREGKLELWQCDMPEAVSKPTETEADFRGRLAPLLQSELATRKSEVEKSYTKKIADANDKVQKAKARVSARRWQFFAKLGGMVWVVVDTVMATMGKNLPGRRRSLDPAIRGMATETGYSSNAKLDLERAEQNLQQLEKQRDEDLKQLETRLSVAGLTLEKLEVKPIKGDIEADEVSLAWLPFRISPAGAAEPIYEVATT
jgi:hypothetical protein